MYIAFNKLYSHLKNKEKPRILIVGSKPKFTHENLGHFDLALFANAAIKRQKFFDADISYNIITEAAYSQNKPGAKISLDQILSAAPENIIINQAIGRIWGRKINPPPKNMKGNIYITTSNQKRAVTVSVLSWAWVLKTMWGLSPNIKYFARELRLLLRTGRSYTMHPSTGVWSILLAIKLANHLNKQCEIVVSGIGLVDDGYDYMSFRPVRSKAHQIDRKIIPLLVEKKIKFLDLSDEINRV